MPTGDTGGADAGAAAPAEDAGVSPTVGLEADAGAEELAPDAGAPIAVDPGSEGTYTQDADAGIEGVQQ